MDATYADITSFTVAGDQTQILLNLMAKWQSKTWLGASDETEEWVGDAAVYVVRGHWRVSFDSAQASEGWADLSWNATKPGSSNVKFRARSAATEAELASASWTSYYESSPIDNEAPDGRWLQLEAVMEEGSSPFIQDISQAYGPGC